MQFEYIIVYGALWHLNETLQRANDIHLAGYWFLLSLLLITTEDNTMRC